MAAPQDSDCVRSRVRIRRFDSGEVSMCVMSMRRQQQKAGGAKRLGFRDACRRSNLEREVDRGVGSDCVYTQLPFAVPRWMEEAERSEWTRGHVSDLPRRLGVSQHLQISDSFSSRSSTCSLTTFNSTHRSSPLSLKPLPLPLLLHFVFVCNSIAFSLRPHSL